MSLSQFLSILRARWRVIIAVFLLTVAAAVTGSLLQTKLYTATATLVVDQTRPDPVTAGMYAGNPSPAFLATQADILRSDRVVRAVIKKLGWFDDPTTRDEWAKATAGRGSMEAWLVDGVQRNLEVRPSRESNVLSVSFTASDAGEAAKIANQFVQSYLDVSLELRVDPARQYAALFDSRSRELRAAVERAQARLANYQREKGVVIATDGQLDVEAARLNELSAQLVAIQATSAESSSRQAQAQIGAGDRLQEVMNNPLLTALRGDVTRAEARLQELTSRLDENHPQLIEARANIASLRARLDNETRRVTGSLGVTSAINRAREAEIRGALEAQRARVLRLRVAREEGAVLIRDVENAQRAYDAVVARLNQTSLESQATQSNAYVLAQASPPITPSSPKVVRNAVLAIVIGLVLAIGAGMLLEYVDRRVHEDDEVSELLGLPMLGVLPKPGGRGQFASRRIPLVTPRAIYRQLPAPHKGG